jgi:uncharacterized protein
MAGSDTRTFAFMAKVVSGHCNLDCEYCYYAGKQDLLGQGVPRMSDEVLEAYIRQNLETNGRNATVEFAWHGGEPTLAGIDFFRKAMELERRYGKGRKTVNTLQTNATLLDDEWCRFFSENGFLLGVSLDGPEEFHDTYRVGPDGGSFGKAMAGIGLLRKHGVSFNTLTTVNAANSGHPREVYDFLRQFTDFMQFLPVVETKGAFFETEKGQHFGMPPGSHSSFFQRQVAGFSVAPKDYGTFLCGVFDRWKELDYGKKFVQMFEVTLGNMRGKPSSLCVHDALCGHAASVEANGDVYACDRYAFENYRLGNLLETPLGELAEKNRRFGMHKAYGLPRECLSCPHVRLCFGGCPKDRILRSPGGQEGKNFLCEGYRIFFRHFRENIPTKRA